MRTHRVVGGGGVKLNVVETGDPKGRPVLFIHGFSQSWLAWNKQLESDLADDLRLVAMDIRGHGASDKPQEAEAYMDAKLWADDVNAVITELDLDGALLCGWSYGPLIICDYIRHYGESHVAGLQFAGGITKLGTEEAARYLTPDILGLVPGCFSNETETTVATLTALIKLFFVNEPPTEDLYTLLGSAVTTPPYVRQVLFSRTLDNDDLLSNLEAPLLVSHGRQDRIVFPAAAEQICSVVPHAELHQPEAAGHCMFIEDAAGFNARLKQFASGISTAGRETTATAAT